MALKLFPVAVRVYDIDVRRIKDWLNCQLFKPQVYRAIVANTYGVKGL